MEIILPMKKTYLLLLCLFTGIMGYAQTKDEHYFKVAKNLDIFNTIYKNLDMMYVDTLDADVTVSTGINAMLRSLDPYTEYYPASKSGDVKMMLTGKYAEVGLKKGDIILSIDGEDMTKKDNEYVSNHLRGDAGTTFELKIHRPSTNKDMKFKITRRAIQLPAVTYYGLQKNGFGYLNLSSFTEGCAKAVRNAVIDMKEKGMKGLVFDLRGNGGGSEYEAVNIVNCFVPKGRLVVSNRGKMKKVNHDYYTESEPVDTLMPVVLLVNGNTASAAEITSGSLQDFDRGVVMGTKTFGKGLVQTVMNLPYNAQMKMTTNKYYIPSGRCIQKINYKHNASGGAEVVADSLTRAFKTLHGRVVRDGGGIMPDIKVEADSMPNITYYLAAVRDSNELIDSWEEKYIATHPTIAKPLAFKLTDDDFNDFKQSVLASSFKYDPMSGKQLDELEKLAKFEGYYDDAKAEFDALRKKLHHNLAKDLDLAKASIMQVLQSDIVTAYYYQRGAVENGLQADKQVQAAFDLLADKAKYNSILQPKPQQPAVTKAQPKRKK